MLPALLLALILGAGGILYLVVFIWKGWKAENLVAEFRRWRCLRTVSKQKHRQVLERDTMDAQGAQEMLLLQILQELRGTEYGKERRFNHITDASSFRSRHPLTGNHHYKDYIQRMAQGEENVLVPSGPFTLVPTAGTSGSPALVPVRAGSVTAYQQQGAAVCLEVLQNSFPGALEKAMKFSIPSNPDKAEAGNEFRPCSSTSSFMNDLYCFSLPSHPTMSHHNAMYTQLLFALKNPALRVLESSFSWVLREVFCLMEARWESLVTDIALGYLDTGLEIPREVREQIERRLEPDASRADELRGHFEKGFEGIAKRIWPSLQVIMAVGSGSSELDSQILKDTVCRGVPLHSPMYCAAEGLIGVNLWPERSTPLYVLCPRSAFFEFIPTAACNEDQPGTVCLQDVRAGEAYELVLTNRDGLCRYRIGDVVRATGFHNQSPILEFLYRRSQTLSVRGESVSEDQFYHTLLHAVRSWPGAALQNYCCSESGILGPFSGGSVPHYEVFVALKGVRDLTEEQRYKLDQALQDRFPIYKSYRLRGSIGPLHLHLVGNQAFVTLLALASSRSGSPPDKIPPPRTLRVRALAESIRKQVLS
uniref:GH3 domain containing n=1 Tax=Leptobrachium leishanense TaxID=445787 RepID=A0A8C5W748_9ANUR